MCQGAWLAHEEMRFCFVPGSELVAFPDLSDFVSIATLKGTYWCPLFRDEGMKVGQ